MALQFLKRRRRTRGGQHISFENKSNNEASSSRKKMTWQPSDAQDIVQQLTEKLLEDQSESTAQTSSLIFLEQEEHGDDSDSDEGSRNNTNNSGGPDNTAANNNITDEESSEEFDKPSAEHPLWLKLPMFADICGNHALVNAERQWGSPSLHTLKRSRELDEVARGHAQEMASASTEHHSNPVVLCAKLTTQPENRLGENVAKGKGLRELHGIMKGHASNYANMMDARYSEMGMATARGANGDWYLCQIFRG